MFNQPFNARLEILILNIIENIGNFLNSKGKLHKKYFS